MKKFILISLFSLGLNAFAQSLPKVKVVLYPCTDAEYQRALKIAKDTTFSKDLCVEIVRKCVDPTYPALMYPPTKIDYYSYKGDYLLGICSAQNLPPLDIVKNYGEYAVALLRDPKFVELIEKNEKRLGAN
jgi:hypothetical protein